MESPNIAMVLRELSPSTSTPVRRYQCLVLLAVGRLAAETTLLPETMNDVVREPGWPLMVMAEMLPR